MEKQQFLAKLEALLSGIPASDREQILDFYREIIEDRIENGASEAAAVADFGNVEHLAQEILQENAYSQKEQQPDQPQPAQQQEERQGNKCVYREYRAMAGAFDKIVINARNTKFFIRPSQDGAIRFCYYEDQDVRYNLNKEGNTLHIEQTIEKKWHWYFLLGVGYHSALTKGVVLELPTPYEGWLEAATTNARIVLENLHLNRLEAVTTNAAIEVKGVQAQELVTNTTNGSITIENTQAQRLNAHTHNGRMTLWDVMSKNCEAATSNGKLELGNVQAEDWLHGQTSNGGIELWGVSGFVMDFHTSNASVSGTVKGDENLYNIMSTTSNGSNELGRRVVAQSRRSLSVKTTNGNIRVRFEQ